MPFLVFVQEKIMETTTIYYVTALISTILFLLAVYSRQHLPYLPTIPGALPILGHLHLLIKARQPLHRTLTALSSTYGPVLLLRFGSRLVLTISSPSAAKNCFTTNHVTFANRPLLLSGKYLGFDHSTLGAVSYGPHWRNLRRIATVELLTSSRIQSFADIRTEETRSLVSSLFSDIATANSVEWLRVEMKLKLINVVFNTMTRIIVGRKYYGEEATVKAEIGKRFRKMIEETFRLSGAASMEDFLPWMGWLGVGRTRRRMVSLGKEIDVFFQDLVDERRQKSSAGTDKSLLDALLELQKQEPEKYSDKIIKGMIWVNI